MSFNHNFFFKALCPAKKEVVKLQHPVSSKRSYSLITISLISDVLFNSFSVDDHLVPLCLSLVTGV